MMRIAKIFLDFDKPLCYYTYMMRNKERELMTTEEMIAEYLAKGGKIAKCPAAVAKGTSAWKYGKGSVSYSGAKHVYMGNISGKKG